MIVKTFLALASFVELPVIIFIETGWLFMLVKVIVGPRAIPIIVFARQQNLPELPINIARLCPWSDSNRH
jgi:hypothetical protein